jgi:hypothetical protein
MRLTSLKRFTLALCAMLIVINQHHAYRQHSQSAARSVDTYGDINCEDAMARLDNFAIELSNEPDARGHIFVYAGRKLPGRTFPHLWWPQLYLTERGIAADRIVVARGDDRDELTVELWIVPKHSPPPRPTSVEQAQRSERITSSKFDEGWADVSVYKGKLGIWGDGMCPLRSLSLKEYANALRAEPNARGHFIIYTAFDKGPRRARTVARVLRSEMVKDHKITAGRITTVYGGRREYPTVELWIVPDGAPTPRPSPETRT